jgi:hypothetical protein
MKEIYPIDDNGFIMWESEKYRWVGDGYIPKENEVDVPIPRNTMFIQPKWDVNEKMWVEGGEAIEQNSDMQMFMGAMLAFSPTLTDAELNEAGAKGFPWTYKDLYVFAEAVYNFVKPFIDA